MNVRVPKSHENLVFARDLRKLRSNPQFFQKKLSNINWESLVDMEDVDTMVTFWTTEINKVLDFVAPCKTRRIKQKKCSLPKEVHELIKKGKELQKSHQINLQSGKVDKELERKFKKHRNYCNKMIRKAVREKTGKNITNLSSVREIWDSINGI